MNVLLIVQCYRSQQIDIILAPQRMARRRVEEIVLPASSSLSCRGLACISHEIHFSLTTHHDSHDASVSLCSSCSSLHDRSLSYPRLRAVFISNHQSLPVFHMLVVGISVELELFLRLVFRSKPQPNSAESSVSAEVRPGSFLSHAALLRGVHGIRDEIFKLIAHLHDSTIDISIETDMVFLLLGRQRGIRELKLESGPDAVVDFLVVGVEGESQGETFPGLL